MLRGGPGRQRQLLIPVNAEHPGTALLFMEYMLDPENAAQNVEWMGYPMPYDGGPTRRSRGS